jgi:hypothetical protein
VNSQQPVNFKDAPVGPRLPVPEVQHMFALGKPRSFELNDLGDPSVGTAAVSIDHGFCAIQIDEKAAVIPALCPDEAYGRTCG